MEITTLQDYQKKWGNLSRGLPADDTYEAPFATTVTQAVESTNEDLLSQLLIEWLYEFTDADDLEIRYGIIERINRLATLHAQV